MWVSAIIDKSWCIRSKRTNSFIVKPGQHRALGGMRQDAEAAEKLGRSVGAGHGGRAE